jgi:hypothetical protein
MHSILINYQQSIWQATIYKEVATRRVCTLQHFRKISIKCLGNGEIYIKKQTSVQHVKSAIKPFGIGV